MALSYTRENLHKPLNVEVLANAVHLSPRQFSRTFQAETGALPGKAIEKLRVEAAKYLVIHSKHPMNTVARATGFENPDRMKRAFLRAFGLPHQVIRQKKLRSELH